MNRRAVIVVGAAPALQLAGDQLEPQIKLLVQEDPS
jgi:hypothetical protein